MTQEEKQLLLIDLCARLPHYTFVEWDDGYAWLSIDRFRDIITNKFGNEWKRPYLRPMSSMTEEEKDEYDRLVTCNASWIVDDWLNAHHFDYRGLIEMGLALEAPEGMYK